MYIGPWQEFKLAQLIKQQQDAKEGLTPQARVPKAPARRRPGVPRRAASEADRDDIASVASSSRSGFSAQSAPAAPAHRGTTSTGGRSSSLRSLQQPVGVAGAKTKAKAKAPKVNPEQQRRERIQAMQKLYGLAAKDEDEDERGRSPPPPAAVEVTPDVVITPDVDRALRDLRASMNSHERGPAPAVAQQHAAAFIQARAPPVALEVPAAFGHSQYHDGAGFHLPSLPEDPLNQSTVSLGSSGGLIAWSKALQKEEEGGSPPASLAGFFKPQF